MMQKGSEENRYAYTRERRENLILMSLNRRNEKNRQKIPFNEKENYFSALNREVGSSGK